MNHDLLVYCDAHGEGRRAFVCGHLSTRKKTGFHETHENTFKGMPLKDDEDYEAWCDNCEKIRSAEGEWNERSEACLDIRVVCEGCYFEIKTANGK